MKAEAPLHRVLIVVQTHINAQVEDLKNALKHLSLGQQIDKVSSIYLAYASPQKNVNSSGRLSVAFTLFVTDSPIAIQQKINRYLKEQPQIVDIALAAYDDETLLSPDITLPHPELHVRPDWLIPSSEIWGEYPHPILSRPLEDIASAADWGGWGHFYAQGTSLIDSPK
jgi:7,8-dihydro-6-hydroxymethylpterin-pyrophosphokinase